MDLAQFDARYWDEVEAAKKGNRAALVAKLREGIEPTRVDLARLADLLEHKNPAHRPKRPKTATARLAAAVDPRALAAEQYRRIMEDLKARGDARGAQDRVNAQVCQEFGIDDPKKFARWRGNSRKRS